MLHLRFGRTLCRVGLIGVTTAVAFAAPAAASSGGAGMGASSAGGAGGTPAGTTGSASPGAHGSPGTHKSSSLGARVLRSGMHGRDVRALQTYLTQDGYNTPVTGSFGPTTRQSLISFQTSHNLRGTGVLTKAVARALMSDVAAKVSSAPAPGDRATLGPDGLAVAPADAPETVKLVIAAANKIAFKPYVYGGGHGSWTSSGYDCSGSVSFALHGGGLIDSPEDSSTLESYGSPGAGQWITIWANAGHTFMEVAGLRFDTGAQSSTGGDRWTAAPRSGRGYVERHPTGF